MSSITIRGCCIGAGRPKVILPIVARTEDDILRINTKNRQRIGQ